MRLLVAIIFLLIYSFQCFAQKENNNWYFGGYAGITFNSGSPVALAPNFRMIAPEGSISVSDSAGNLLFYSDGVTIWNRVHLPMPNADRFLGLGLMGHVSATQSVLAVPKPGSKTIYYIFTVDAQENNLQNGLRYSILDMSLDGGLGDITNTKNILLETLVTEKLTAVRHGNNKDYWILAHKWNSDEFVAYKLTSAGVSNASIISKTGSVHSGSTVIAATNAAGQMKANRKGTKIALAISDLGKFEVFDFNAFSGIVSNGLATSGQIDYPYGVEFSGDGTKLYGTSMKFTQSNITYWYNLLQFDLADPAGLNKVNLIHSAQKYIGSPQIGPDNKIYCSYHNVLYLGVVNNPDSIGVKCNYNYNGLSLNNNSLLGLPNMIITARKPVRTDLGMDTTICIGDTLMLGQEAIDGNSYLWQDSSNKSTFVVTKPGKYKVRVKNWYFNEAFEFNIQFKDCPPVVPDIPNNPTILLFPNIITPNQDNLNDAFVLKNLNAVDFELQIYNRWGSLVYKTESYKNDWDANGNSAGLYYYLLRNSETGTTYKGWLEVIK